MVDTEILIHAFVLSRLDYCNTLFSGLLCESTKTPQMVQNASARVLHIQENLIILHQS